jgi:hypothetical protein
MANTQSLEERVSEIRDAMEARLALRTIDDLVKSPKLERSRAARREAWASLAATASAHLQELDRLAAQSKRARKRAVEPAPEVSAEPPPPPQQ